MARATEEGVRREGLGVIRERIKEANIDDLLELGGITLARPRTLLLPQPKPKITTEP